MTTDPTVVAAFTKGAGELAPPPWNGIAVGRIVHVSIPGQSDHLAAIVSKAWSSDMVNLTVFREDGSTEGRTYVRYTPQSGVHWHWPERVE